MSQRHPMTRPLPHAAQSRAARPPAPQPDPSPPVPQPDPSPPVPQPDPSPPVPAVAEVLVMTRIAVGLRNPPCCGRAFVPRVRRTKRIGDETRRVDSTCPYCAHELVITYTLRDGQWYPVQVVDRRSGRTHSEQR